MSSKLGKLCRNQTIFFCCDIQERFRELIHNFKSIEYVGKTMIQAANVMNIRTIVTEQYPKAFKHTIPELGVDPEKNPLHKVFQKSKFSMVTEEVEKELKLSNKKQVVLFGIEAHVCVFQTALELIEKDYDVHVAADGVSSQRPFDRAVAFDRMKQIGAHISTSEMILFQLMENADYEKFKDVTKLINPKTNPRPDPGFYPTSSQ